MLKDTIYTIPINDVFSPKCGCPVCLMRDMLEKRCVEYIMGAAMMEPDIRIETNKKGFCQTHFEMLSLQKNKLSLALMLETHLDELQKKYMPPKESKKSDSANAISSLCYVCSEISSAMDKMLDTAVRLYFADTGFKADFEAQPFFCFPHYELLCQKAISSLNKKQAALFISAITKITSDYITELRDNVHRFSTMFDYRNSSEAAKEESVKESIPKSISFLLGR